MSLPAEQQDRAAGALLGLALGDALGAGYEFGPVVDPASVGMVGGGPAGWQPGEWTDATAMAICIGRVAVMSPDLDHPVALAAVGEAFGECSARARGAVLGAIRGGSAVGPDRFARASDTGSLVRTAPVALACLGDDDALAEVPKLVSAITHADPIAGEACVVWCAAIDRAVRTGRVDGVHDGPALLRPDRGVFWAGVLAGATRAEPPEVEPDGAAVRALRTAWATIARSDRIPFDEVLRRTVAQGGDGRGVAALVGELLGAARGASTLPFRWSRVLHGWPDWRGGDLVRLGAAIARREGDWTIPWEPGDFPPIAVPLVDDPGVLVGNIEALRVVDADAFVSLCRLRAEQVRPPYHHEVWLVDDANAMAPQNLDAALTQAVEAVATFRAEGRRVFLHCVSGVSRTGAVASLYLARRLGVSGLDALERVRATRPAVAPNAGLLAAIRRLAP